MKDNISQHLLEINPAEENWKEKSDEYWKDVLTSEQFKITRKAATERPFSGKYDDFYEVGVFSCSNCGLELFTSDQKFKSGCGWPSFSEQLNPEVITTSKDTSHGMLRIEISCTRCEAHLGHLFDDGPLPEGKRYCVNSLSLNFKDKPE